MQSRRYIFIDYEDLIKIKFKKLEKICNRIFVFVSSEVSNVPLQLVQQMQRMGKDVKWISVESPKNGTSLHISFLMGKLHEKVSTDIEFAILSDEESFDPLINFMNDSGRNCLRVKQKGSSFKEEYEEDDELEEIVVEMIEEEEEEEENDYQQSDSLSDILDFGEAKEGSGAYESESIVAQSAFENEVFMETISSTSTSAKTAVISKPKKVKKSKRQAVEKIAEETIRRLIRSGNRPSELSMLKSYILLHHQDQDAPESVEMVIDYMKETKDIRLEEEEVIYNF